MAYYVVTKGHKMDFLNQERGSPLKIYEDWETVKGRILREDIKARTKICSCSSIDR